MIKFSDIPKAHKYTVALAFFIGLVFTYHSQFLTDVYAAEAEGQTRQMRIDQIEYAIASLERDKARETVQRIKAMIQSEITRLDRKLKCVQGGGTRC